MKPNDELIDVRKLMAASSIEEHCRLAENYFARLKIGRITLQSRSVVLKTRRSC
jgi:hypothetical protein